MTDEKRNDGVTQPAAAIESDGTDLFVVVDGVRIAKRGHPDTPHAKTWIALEPGFMVFDSDGLNGITVEKKDAAEH